MMMRAFAAASQNLSGTITVPGDKSISHRALLLGALASGVTRVSGLLESDDVLRTGANLRALGTSIENERGVYTVTGGRFAMPDRVLYAGNAGTGVRLLMGAVAGQSVTATFDGDASLRARPMGRVLEPLSQMGISYTDCGGKLPVCITAAGLSAIRFRLPSPSAQVKSAILLAGLGARGETVVEEPILCRDHTERMLRTFGVTLDIAPLQEGGRRISMKGGQPLTACDILVPGDPSSAAFPIVAAIITPGSDVTVKGVLMNPQRIGLYQTLLEMGARLDIIQEREEGGERVADLRARYGRLTGVHVPAERAPSMIDEYPILAIAAAFADGQTHMPGLEELRVKESDRLGAVEAGLQENGAIVVSGPDWLTVTGQPDLKGGGFVKTCLDHRIAMSFLIMGLASNEPVTVDSIQMIATSFPDFMESITGLGAKLVQHEGA